MLTGLQQMGWRLSAFALLALLIRALVPSGYMIAEADVGNGRFVTVQMCSGHATPPRILDLKTGTLLEEGDVPVDSDREASTAPCVFASTGAFAAPLTPAEVVVFPVERAVEFRAVRDVRSGRGLAAPPPPATGPPSLI